MANKDVSVKLDVLLKIKELLNMGTNDNPIVEVETSDDEKYLEMLEITIDEQRRVYDGVENNYRQVKTRTLAFLAGGFAVMTFLYSSGETFFPRQTYGQVFYAIAFVLLIYGFGLLFKALQPAQWEYPTEKARIMKLDFKSKKHYLEYIVGRYLTCYDNNIKICEDKHRLLRNSFYPLVIGAIILVLLNIFKEKIT